MRRVPQPLTSGSRSSNCPRAPVLANGHRQASPGPTLLLPDPLRQIKAARKSRGPPWSMCPDRAQPFCIGMHVEGGTIEAKEGAMRKACGFTGETKGKTAALGGSAWAPSPPLLQRLQSWVERGTPRLPCPMCSAWLFFSFHLSLRQKFGKASLRKAA